MTYTPNDLKAVLDYMNSKGAPYASLGCVAGPSDAQSGGYHCGHDLLHAIGVAPEDPGWDYSYGESNRDRYGLTDAASAIDFAGASWWHDLTLWLVGRCAAGAPGTEDIREIIYTPDFSVVRRWDRLGIRSSGDSSHLYHTHISFFRDAEGRRNGSFLNLIKSYFGEAPAVASNKKELEGEEYMGQLPHSGRTGRRFAWPSRRTEAVGPPQRLTSTTSASWWRSSPSRARLSWRGHRRMRTTLTMTCRSVTASGTCRRERRSNGRHRLQRQHGRSPRR
jgi:hypothetical protein